MTLLFSCNANSAGSSGGDSGNVKKESGRDSVSLPVFSADSAYAFVAEQVGFGPRVPGSAAHGKCAAMLEKRLKDFGAESVTVHSPVISTPYARDVKISNIFARYNSGAPRRILLLAHWDTRPVAEEDPDPEKRELPIPGANDGASGAAVLLEIARILGQNPLPKVGVDLLFVDAEDSGNHSDDMTWCLGTQAWLKDYPSGVPGAYSPEYAVLLDMVGGKDARFHREMFSDSHSPGTVNEVWAAAAAAGARDLFVNGTGGAITDDHVFFNKSGIAAIDIIESRNSRTGGFNPTWHTHADNMDNISAKTLEGVGKTLIYLLYNKK